MGKLNQNIILFKGDALPIEFLHVGPFWQTQRQVISLIPTDEIEWRMFEKDNPNGTTYIKKTRALGGIEVYTSGYWESNDTIKVQLEPVDTSSLTEGLYSHQLEIKYSGTAPIIVASGEVDVIERAEGDVI